MLLYDVLKYVLWLPGIVFFGIESDASVITSNFKYIYLFI